MSIAKWFLTNVENGDVLTFFGSPWKIDGMKVIHRKKNGKKERIIEYQGEPYFAEVRRVTQYDDVPCTSDKCKKAKSKISECKCQCAGKNHGEFYKIEAEENT